MGLIRTEAEAALTELHERWEEQAARYRAEAEAGLYPELLEALASGWESHARTLADHLRKSDVLPKAADPEHEALTRYVDHVRAWFSDKDDDAALIERLLDRETALATLAREALGQVSEAESALLEAALEHGEKACRSLERQAR